LGNSTSRFCTIESHGNDSKTKKLGALWTETERRWKAIFHLRIADSKTTEKRFFASDCDWRWEYSTTTPRRKSITLSPVVAIDLNINTTAEHSWFEDHALYLVGPKGLVYYELLKPADSITGDWYRQLIRLSHALREKRPEYEQRQSYSSSWQRSASYC